MSHDISPTRKLAFYSGILLQIVGFLLVFSIFLSVSGNFGQFFPDEIHVFDDPLGLSGIQSPESRQRAVMLKFFGSMVCVGAGTLLYRLGARGLAGAGVVLDPHQARADLEPYSRMAGGMVRDALDEAKLPAGVGPTQVVMVRCRACGGLSQETARFCQECGGKL